MRDASGKRAVGTKCSQRVADTVLKQGKSFVGRADVLGEEFLSAYEPLKDGSGQIIGMIYVGLSAHEFDGIRGDFIRSVLLAMAIIVFVTGGLAYLVLGRALKPLEMLTERLQKIADGDMRGEPVPIDTGDEIGQLGHCANDMQRRLSRLIRNVAESSQSVASAAQELMSNANQAADSVRSVAESTIHMSEGAAGQSETVGSLEEETRDMSGKVEALADSAHSMQEVSRQSQERARAGRQNVEQAVSQVQQIAQ